VKTRKVDWGLLFIAAVCIIFVALAIIPNFVRARAQGRLTACKSNLKNIGTAMEMYSTDYDGKYPPNLNLLTPKYLKTIPVCPTARANRYFTTLGPEAPLNYDSFEDYYLIECAGTAHSIYSAPPFYPKYSGIEGLIDR
jgi:type II secretory pathway pseudopilin PulG